MVAQKYELAGKRAIASIILVSIWGTALLAEPLPGSEWEPVELNGSAFTPVGEIFLRFENDGRFFGNAGCNTARGQFVTNGDAILFGAAATTRMACPEDIAQQEFAFLQALNAARGFDRDATTMTLTDSAGGIILRLQQRRAN